MEEVVDKNIKLVVGPIFTNSVEAVSQIAIDNNIVIISFSNNSDLANHKGIFLAGFSPEQEIDRITSYLIDSGKSNFSIIAPNNQYGIRISKTLREMVEIKDANFVASQFYIRSKKDFSKIANNILRSYIVSKDVDQYKEELEQIEDKKEREARELEIISEHKIYVDTVLIADSSNKAGRIAKEIRDHNFDGRDIRIIGTSHWDKDLIFSNPNLSNSLFAGPNGKYYEKFKQKYQNVYKKDPIRISSIAYDVTAFVIDLVDDLKGKRPTSNAITFYNGKKGYRGIDGLFRFLPNGIAQRNLSVLQINNGSFRIIDRAQRRFLNY
jgi:ABC-type branched-subunit amino acid transport system substrate-binding protein